MDTELNCKDCIHYEVCERKDGTSTYTIESPSLMVTKEINCITCSHFKDRSKFIELPCELGDRLYAINGKGEIKSWKIICIRAIKSSIQWNPEHIEYTVGCEKSNGIMWIHLDKTKNVYFSFEECLF